ncbi:prolipoprotein diacylglyceryl transferase [Gordonia aurantiaca]|uniref:prolipoprotein diacylglyceryl transferase n=1 Tax=Gordonia sp. B21 TaxID=3151852 RepID=UPI003267DF6C
MMAPTSTMLAYIPSPPQGVWNLGPFPLRAYALCIIVGIIVAVWWGNRRWVARGGQEGEVLDVAIWAVPFGLLGGRLYHLITDWRTYFGADAPKDPIDAIRIWDGGLGIWGAVALGAVGAWIGARRNGIRLPAFGDAIAPPILLAQAIGRLGNYFNQELYGRETTLPWGLKIYERVNDSGYADPGLIDGVSNGVVVAVVQPTFLYELLWNVLVVIALVLIDRRFRIGHGRLFALYIAGYCLGRFFIEMLRDDRAAVANYIAGIRPNLFTAAIVFACAVVYFVVAPKGREQGLEMYHPERAAELEEQGVAGYVDDWYEESWDAEDLDADTEVVDSAGLEPTAAGPEDVHAAETVEIEPEGADDETVEVVSGIEATESEAGEAEVAVSEPSAEAEATKSEATGSEATESGATGSEATGSEATGSEATGSGAAEPKSTEPEALAPDADLTEADASGADASGAEMVEDGGDAEATQTSSVAESEAEHGDAEPAASPDAGTESADEARDEDALGEEASATGDTPDGDTPDGSTPDGSIADSSIADDGDPTEGSAARGSVGSEPDKD